MILRLTLLGASALAFNFSVASADEARLLDPVEVTGLRPVEADQATVSVSVLTADELAVRASPNPADQLRGVPGAAVSRSGSLGGLTQVRFRGAEANHTLVLFEGIEISDPVNGDTDFGLLTALPVGRIEVLRGASSFTGTPCTLSTRKAFPSVLLTVATPRSRWGSVNASTYGCSTPLASDTVGRTA